MNKYDESYYISCGDQISPEHRLWYSVLLLLLMDAKNCKIKYKALVNRLNKLYSKPNVTKKELNKMRDKLFKHYNFCETISYESKTNYMQDICDIVNVPYSMLKNKCDSIMSFMKEFEKIKNEEITKYYDK